MPKIKITDQTGLVPEMYYPKPSKAVIPSWFRSLAPRVIDAKILNEPGDGKGHSGKRCIPMLDAMTAGYTIFTSEDIQVESDCGLPYFRWTRREEVITFHANQQMSTYPGIRENEDVPKWNNPWVIKTPPGYSCIFTNPMNNPETEISIFSGVVDTDTYTESVNFPFLLKNPDFNGLIPAGTPIAQVIPFARESWQMELNTISEKEILQTREKVGSVFWDKYKRLFWSKKQFN